MEPSVWVSAGAAPGQDRTGRFLGHEISPGKKRIFCGKKRVVSRGQPGTAAQVDTVSNLQRSGREGSRGRVTRSRVQRSVGCAIPGDDSKAAGVGGIENVVGASRSRHPARRKEIAAAL